ncbi:tyrosine-type recombinase/integrase [Paucibacter sp. R3-3]|uniref:Tyrosine-type recombinase/integrase n=1 Tax=Roseateles agri TaxID=3098619 RepID=A0ABU5DPA9_9BURK|nr:tyrosine-type recombinase/integrase [Paucibacter sp. R3-3]MDY0747939.1 tyrosine-type recombinase/integrase [Paucibacter sp. R3-3]
MGARKNNGSIAQRQNKGGAIAYQAILRIQGGKAFVKSFDNEPEARAWLESIANDVNAHRESVERKRRQDMLALAAMSPENRQRKLLEMPIREVLLGFVECPLARDRHKVAVPAMLLQVKQATIRDIKKAWVKGYVDGMRARKTYRGSPYAYATIVRQFAVLRQAIEWQAEELEAEPPKIPFTTKAMFPRNWEGKRKRRLAPEEQSVLEARLASIEGPSRPHWELLLGMALETGARLQELVGMRWDEISANGGDSVWVIPETREKTAKERRVPLSPGAVTRMAQLTALRDPQDPRVFHTLGDPETISALFRRYSRQAGLVDFRFHDLRHEAISRMVAKTPDIYKVMKIVGHNSPEMLDLYANLRDSELASAYRPNSEHRPIA